MIMCILKKVRYILSDGWGRFAQYIQSKQDKSGRLPVTTHVTSGNNISTTQVQEIVTLKHVVTYTSH